MRQGEEHASSLGGARREARVLLTSWWRASPSYPAAFSWRSTRAAALRTLCCAALIWASLAHFTPEPHVDLYPSYLASRLADEGRWDHIYHPALWLYGGVDPVWEARARALGIDTAQGTSFVYHPWYLYALRPLAAHVDYPTFQRLWVWLSKGCIVGVGLCLSLLLGWRTLGAQLLATLLVAHASPTLSGIDVGQNVLPALLFSLAAALAWRSRAPLWLGGLFAAAAWCCKPWCALLPLLCFALRGLRAGAATALGLALLMLALPPLLLPAALMRDYAALNLALTRVTIDGWNNLSLLSLLERSARPDWSLHLLEWIPSDASSALRASALGLAAALGASGVLVWWRRRPDPASTTVAWLAFMLLPLGVCWTHYFLFVLPLALAVGFAPSAPPALRAAALVLLVLVTGMAVWYDVPRAQLLAYRAAPPRYPWFQALPLALSAAVALACLWFAPCARRASGAPPTTAETPG
jgi:hypothetical protein